MNTAKLKYNIPVITADIYNQNPTRYELRKGNEEAAPLCPYGNNYEWIGFDKERMCYIRVTKSVFKKLIKQVDNDE